MAKGDRKQQPEPGWLNKTDMAASCGVSVQAFDQWGVEPVARIGRNAYFKVSDVIANRLAKQMTRMAAAQPLPDPNLPLVVEAEREKMLLVREQRIGQELRNAEKRKELAPVAVLEWALSNLAAQIVAQLDAVPLRMKKMYPGWGARQIEDLSRELIKSRNAASEATLNLDDYLDRDPEGD